MIGRSATRLIDDPRVVTLAVVALVSAGLWVALWQSMGGTPMQTRAGMMPGIADAASSAFLTAPGMFGTPEAPGWSVAPLASTALMWLLMMAAMMLPSAAPMLAVYAGLAAREDRGAALALRVGLFALGYLLLWAVFAVTAAVGQSALREGAYLTVGGTLAAPVAASVLLLIAGAWQFMPMKKLCLRHCRHPLHYLMLHWREGTRGAFPLGARHGLYCFGCCAAFMGLMFVFGAMDVLWMAAIAVYFLAEKVLPRERLWGRATGALLIAAGAAMLAREVI